MALFQLRPSRRRRQHSRRGNVQIGGGCPQPSCNHPSHGGIPVPRRYSGTSRLDGMVVHHVRCVLNPAHHLRFVKVGGRWHQLQS